MFLLVTSLVLCACANGLAVGENTAAPFPLVYKSYANNGSYVLVDVPMNFVDASEVCRLFNGHLAFPETAAELAVLQGIIAESGTGYALIGFHDQFVEGKYVSMKGQFLKDLNYNISWIEGQPNGDPTQNCGGISALGIRDLFCDTKYQSICEENDSLGEGEFLGYEQIGPYGIFRMMEVNATWPDAFETCQGQGSHLWIVNSAGELAAVLDHYGTRADGFWTGVHHVYANHFFVTIFDEKLETTGYSSWAPSEPSGNNTVYPYVLVTESGMYNRINPRYFICEYNQPF